MDFRILLYLPMMFYIVHCSSNADSNEEDLRRQMQSLRSKAQAITTNMQHLALELQHTGNSEAEVPRQQSKRTIRTIIQATLNQINNDVKGALRKGKNEMKVANCMNQVKTILLSVQGNKENALEVCQDDAVIATATEIYSLEPFQKRGVQLIGQVNSVVSRCENPNLYLVQKCIGARIRELNKDVGILTTNALKQKAVVRTNFKNVFTTLKKCNSNIVSSAHIEIRKAKHDLDVCLQRA